MKRDALSAALEHINRMNDLVPRQVQEAEAMARALQHDRQLLEASLGPASLMAIHDARSRWDQFTELDSAQLRAMQDLMPSLAQIPDQVSAMQGFLDAMEHARAYLDQGSGGFLQYARESLDDFLESVYRLPAELVRDPARWLDEEIEQLLADDPDYRQSRLAWILVMLLPRFRLALYEQDSEGDFDGAMQLLWQDLINDPEVRARLRERLEKSGVREELRRSLSSHLDKLDAGEYMYVIIGLYAHIEGFLAELAVERGLIPDKETILHPDGSKKKRRGVSDLIKTLHDNGQIDDSQERFLTFVLSNSYEANRLRHGTSYEFTQERATALVLGLILVLCLSWGLPPDELLEDDEDKEVEEWIDELLADEPEGQDAEGREPLEAKGDDDKEVEEWIDELLADGEESLDAEGRESLKAKGDDDGKDHQGES